MSNLLKKGALWLGKQKREHAAETVRLRRSASSVTVRAEIGRKQFQIDQGDGLMTEWEARDYLIFADEYAFDDVPVEPKTGDQIIEGDPANGQIYEVMGMAGVQCWQWSDEFRQRYRVHAKYVGTSPQ